MSVQVKVEQALLAEIMFNGNQLCCDLDFYLEENRRDLTVRLRDGEKLGSLLEWVEAKMCYTDCIARTITKKSREMEYRDSMRKEADKHDIARTNLPKSDMGAKLTLILFAVHHQVPQRRQKYYKGFGNRHSLTAKNIEDAAREHVHRDIAPFIGREVVEEFPIELNEETRVWSFVLRAGR